MSMLIPKSFYPYNPLMKSSAVSRLFSAAVLSCDGGAAQLRRVDAELCQSQIELFLWIPVDDR